MELYCYQAECGDALRIRYIGDDGNPHNIFLDSGYERTFRYVLQQEINSLIDSNESIDLWIISHIHDDHIGGAIKYSKSVNDSETKDIVKTWFYNPPRKYSIPKNNNDDISSAKSIRQGDLLYDFLLQTNKLPTFDITTNLSCQNLFGLKMYILSPTSTTITELREKYKDGRLLVRNEIDTISSTKAASIFDYDRLLESFDLNNFEEDDSLENRSSISLLFEFEDKKILWLADSHPTVVYESLSKMGFSEINPLICDFVIVSHHASKGNNSSELYHIIRCDNYLVSSDGENTHCLPTKEALSRIIRNPRRDLAIPYNLYFAYDTDNLKRIFQSDTESVYRKWNFKTIYTKDKSLLFRL
ncbi:MAG: hypothetical protein LBQ60_08755 [Bacteroidales bacterium]|jgi:beta-lactamase superfamily II metal-dependent hydrolase|nr:hypothetical protein [Bacteroidales bacterium]